MTDVKKIYLFEKMPITKAVAKLAIPTILSSLVMVIYNLADTYFVGLLNDSIQTAAVTLAAPVLLLFNAIINLFGVGTGSYMSRLMGKKEYEKVKDTSVYGIYSSLALALLFSIIFILFRKVLLNLLGADPTTYDATSSYLFYTVIIGAAPSIMNLVIANLIRSEGESMHASIGTMMGCFLNMILDPIFILPKGLNMGASGAGCATMISNACACLYFIIYIIVKRKTTLVSVDIRKYKINKEIVFAVGAVGIPAAIQNILNVTGMTILNKFTAPFGADAISAMGITHKINMVPLYFSMGLGQGIMPLVGYNFAKGDNIRLKKSIKFAGIIAVSIILAATTFYYFGAEFIISLFMKKQEVVDYGTSFLKGFCLGLPFLAIDFYAVGIFQAVGMGLESFVFALLRKIGLEIPALIVLNKLYPLYGLAYSQLVAEFVLAIAAIFMLYRLFKKVDKKALENTNNIPKSV